MASITLPKSAFIGALKPCVKVASPRSPIPVLQCVRLTLDDGVLHLVGGDGERWAGRCLAGQWGGDGDVCINAVRLSAATDAISGDSVTVTFDARGIRLSSGRHQISLDTLDPEDYPGVPSNDADSEMVIPFGQLAAGVAQVRKAAEDSSGRAILGCVQFNVGEGRAKLLSTNTHFALRASCDADGSGSAPVFVKSLDDIMALGFAGPEDVRITFSRNKYRCERGGDWCAGGIIQGEYPKVERVFPDSFTRCWEVDAEDLKDALRLAKSSGDNSESFLPVVFESCGESLVVRTRKDAQNAVIAPVDAKTQGIDEGFRVGLNGLYVLDIVASAPGRKIRIECTEPRQVVRFACEGIDHWDAAILPMDLGVVEK